MDKKYITENKTLVKEFIGNLVRAIVQKRAEKLIKNQKMNDLKKTDPKLYNQIKKKYDI